MTPQIIFKKEQRKYEANNVYEYYAKYLISFPVSDCRNIALKIIGKELLRPKNRKSSYD
jgi:hypothetical protein